MRAERRRERRRPFAWTALRTFRAYAYRPTPPTLGSAEETLIAAMVFHPLGALFEGAAGS
jgi:hypothetical protein